MEVLHLEKQVRRLSFSFENRFWCVRLRAGPSLQHHFDAFTHQDDEAQMPLVRDLQRNCKSQTLSPKKKRTLYVVHQEDWC